MIIEKKLEILDGLPILFIKDLSAIICSDLHLGYEGIAADSGTFLPKINLKNIKNILKKAKDLTDATSIIITGDIKNDFSKVHTEEFNEYIELIDYIKSELLISDIKIIKGNHDNFIDSINKNGIKIYGKEAVLSNYTFIHGSGLPKEQKSQFIIMGHVHPSLLLINDTGKKEKLKCFLYCKNKNSSLLVLPALSYFAEGLSVNIDNVEDMAPIFKKMFDINDAKALCIGDMETLSFGKIGNLKKISKHNY